MHKFKIEIDIEDKNYCNGCPVLQGKWCMFHMVYLHLKNVRTSDVSDYDGLIRPTICKELDKEK